MITMKKRKLLLTCAGLLITSFALSSCGDDSELPLDYVDNGEEYKLTYYMVYNDSQIPSDMSTVERRASAILKEKINSTIEIIPYTYAEYTQKMNGIIATAAKFDVCFTAPEVNPYGYNIKKEAFLPLDHLLPTYAPKTWESINSNIWNQIKVNGHIYGSINEQIFPRTLGMRAKSPTNIQDFLNENYDGIKPSEIYAHIEDPYDFVEEYLRWLKLNNRGNGGAISEIHTESYLMNYAGYDDLCSGITVPGVINISDTTHTVVNQFETQEYKDMIDLVYKWKNLGYLKVSSNYDITPDSTWKPGYLSNQMMRLSDPHYFTTYVCGSMNAISSTSKNPARAMKFIELLRTDEELHNLLQFGKENTHYLKDPEQPDRIAEFISGSGYNNENFGWGLGTEFISYLTPGQDDDQWEQVKKINDETELTDLIGFRFDDTNVYTEVSNCRNVVNTYIEAFAKGEFDESNKSSTYQKFIEDLKNNGMERILKEKQEQVDAYFANK